MRATAPTADLRNGTEAMRLAERACSINGDKQATLLATLAAAYAEAGDFDSAVRFQEKALNLKKSEPPRIFKGASEKVTKDMAARTQPLLPGFSQRLESYKQHRPYRDVSN